MNKLINEINEIIKMNINTVNLLNNYSFDIIKLDLSSKQINGILNLDKFCNLTELNCNENKITNLDNLPNSLIMLNYEKVVKK